MAKSDTDLVEAICAYEAYLDDHQQAIELLKQASKLTSDDQGFLKLTMSKLALPAHALSELSYKDVFESTLYVAESNDGTLSVIKAQDRMQSSTSTPDEGKPVQRRNKTNRHEDNEEVSNDQSTGSNDEDQAIMWFSSLPPQHLRLAQKQFRSGLHALVNAATNARKVQNTMSSAIQTTT